MLGGGGGAQRRLDKRACKAAAASDAHALLASFSDNGALGGVSSDACAHTH